MCRTAPAGLRRIVGDQIVALALLVLVLTGQEHATESLGFLKTALDVAGAEGGEAGSGFADCGFGAFLGVHLDHEAAALDGVDEDVAGFEGGVAGPATDKGDETTAFFVVVFGVDLGD